MVLTRKENELKKKNSYLHDSGDCRSEQTHLCVLCLQGAAQCSFALHPSSQCSQDFSAVLAGSISAKFSEWAPDFVCLLYDLKKDYCVHKVLSCSKITSYKISEGKHPKITSHTWKLRPVFFLWKQKGNWKPSKHLSKKLWMKRFSTFLTRLPALSVRLCFSSIPCYP